MRTSTIAAATLTIAMSQAPTQAANDLRDQFHGRLEVQDFASFSSSDSLDEALGARNRNDLLANLRVKWEPTWGEWSAAFHYLVSGAYGDSVPPARQTGLLAAPPSTLLDLTSVISDDGKIHAEQSIDRLSISYTTPEFVVRVGRQALTWGGGLVFGPMDLFNPFSPGATDTEYKPGADMVYAQWLFEDGSDIQAIAVARPRVKGGGPTGDDSSFAVQYRARDGDFLATWLIARDHSDWTAAFEMAGPLLGGAWVVEVVPTIIDGGQTRISALANVSYSTTLFDRNATLFAEYFHNGFGQSGDEGTFLTLEDDLVDRLSRGQVFNLRRDYLAGGVTLEWSPLLNLSSTLIVNLNDQSIYAFANANYSLSDNLTLIGGALIPAGAPESEYGGFKLQPGSDTVVGPPAQVYFQMRQYF